MLIPITKMHGNGNDFVLLDNRDGSLELTAERVRALADRRFGVGCDQLLVAQSPRNETAPVAMGIFNTDGSSAEQCGNGLRCFAVYARDRGMAHGSEFPVETPCGLVTVQLMDGGRVRACMGVPRLEPARIPLQAPARAATYELIVNGEMLRVGAVSMGNPHAVLLVEDVDAAPVTRLGPAVQAMSAFPEGVNVGFMQVLNRNGVRLRVFERGVGETLACGSGACAAVVTGRIQGLLDEWVDVSLPGGDLRIGWAGEGREVSMEGPTALVFTGEAYV